MPSALRPFAQRRTDIFHIHVNDLRIDPDWRARRGVNLPDLDALIEDIAENGQLQAITVTADRQVLYGERRWTAIYFLHEEGRHDGIIKCAPAPKGTLTDHLHLLLSENSGVPFSTLEKGRVYQRILDSDPDLRPADIARRHGCSKQSVSDALLLVNQGDPKVLESVDRGFISSTLAVRLIKDFGDNAAQILADTVKAVRAKDKDATHITAKHLPPAPDQDSKTPPPPDPGAIDRIKNTPDPPAGGTGGGTGGGGGATPDKRLAKLESFLESTNTEKLNPTHLSTLELVLDYLRGDHDIRSLKKHLQSTSPQ